MTDFRLTPFPVEFLTMVKNFEGFSKKAYRCPAGVLTIGYGHTGNDVTSNLVISKMEAEYLLICDLRASYIHLCSIEQFITLPFNEQLAVLSFVFNLGFFKFKKTQMYLDLCSYISSSNKPLVAQSFRLKLYHDFNRFVYANKRVLRGLEVRRGYESKLFLFGTFDNSVPDTLEAEGLYQLAHGADLPF